MAQKVDLDEREHALNILQRLHQMKQDQQHCDFIVSVDGEEFHTHRNILSAGSDYFNAMLTHDTKESQLGRAEMIDVDSECVAICLKYIYTGKADIPLGKIEKLVHVACLMQLDKLCNALSQLLENSLDIGTFYSTKRIAEMYDVKDVLAACTIFEQENILLLSCQHNFQSEEAIRIVEILAAVALTEQEKLILSLRWVGSFAERKQNLLRILKSINLEVVADDYLLHILENNPLAKIDLDLYKVFNAPLVKKLKADRNEIYVSRSLILFDGTSGCLQQLNPRTKNVEKVHDANFTKFWPFSAIALHSHLYILSQDKSVHRLKFKDKNAKWRRMKNIIESHGAFPPTVSLNGSLYVIGGSHGQITSALEQFCIEENHWVRLKDKPVATNGAVLVTLGGLIYSLGGETEEKVSNAFFEFNPQSAIWTELEPMRQAKHSCGATAVNQKIYVFGGDGGEDIFSDMDCYDVTLKQWTRLSPMIQSHYSINGHHISGWIFAIEQLEDSGKIEKYDTERDKWQTMMLNDNEKFKNIRFCTDLNLATLH